MKLCVHRSRRDAVSAAGQRDSVPFTLRCKFKALSPVPYTWWQKLMPAHVKLIYTESLQLCCLSPLTVISGTNTSAI